MEAQNHDEGGELRPEPSDAGGLVGKDLGTGVGRTAHTQLRLAAKEFIAKERSLGDAILATGEEEEQSMLSFLGMTKEEVEALDNDPDLKGDDLDNFMMDKILSPIRTYQSELRRLEDLLLEDPMPEELGSIPKELMTNVIEIREHVDKYAEAFSNLLQLYQLMDDPLASFRIDREKVAIKMGEIRTELKDNGQAARGLTMRLLNEIRPDDSNVH